MKNYISLLFLSVFFCFCSKNVSIVQPATPTDPTPIDTIPQVVDTTHSVIAFGTSSMKKDGVLWQVPIKLKSIGSTRRIFGLSVQFSNENSLTGGFGIFDISCKEGKYPVEGLFITSDIHNSIPNATFGYTYEGDQPVGHFEIDTTRTDHYLEILRYDSIEHIVEGRFQMFMVKEAIGFNFPGVPLHSIDITEGKFNLKIQ